MIFYLGLLLSVDFFDALFTNFILFQVMVWGTSTVAEVVSEPIQEAGAVIAGLPSGPLSTPQTLALTAPLPPPSALSGPPAVLLFLGGSKAPVDPRASALSLEGEVIVVENEPPIWDGKDLETFLAWEKMYGELLNCTM